MTQTDITRKLSNRYSLRGLREKAITHLLHDRLMITGPWFASSTSNGSVTFHQGFLKGFPDDNAQDKSRFAALLAVYGIDHEAYHLSFNDGEQFLVNDDTFLPRELTIQDISSKSWSFSTTLVERISASSYLKSRIEIDPAAVCQGNNANRIRRDAGNLYCEDWLDWF